MVGLKRVDTFNVSKLHFDRLFWPKIRGLRKFEKKWSSKFCNAMRSHKENLDGQILD